jgi:hypothetical protein
MHTIIEPRPLRVAHLALRLVCLLGVVAFGLARPALAQQHPDGWVDGVTTFYNLTDPNHVAIHVHVWGTVRNPGLYAVPRGTSFGMLLSAAGGPAIASGNHGERRVVRVRLQRPNGVGYDEILSREWHGDLGQLPEDVLLHPGDVVTVETRVNRLFGWRDTVSLVSVAASVALVAERILAAGRR